MRLSIITPTIGRPSLQRLMEFLNGELQDGDEHIVVADLTKVDSARLAEIAQWVGAKTKLLGAHSPTSQYGNAQRDTGMGVAGGEFLAFMDDDDCYEPGAIETIRAAVGEVQDSVHIFTVPPIDPPDKIDDLIACTVGTPNVVIPNIRARLARWADYYGGCSDYDFIRNTIRNFEDRITRHRITIGKVRP